jgi:hypothetical protein
MIYRSDITTRDGTNREGGVYITVKTDSGGLAPIFDRDGNPLSNPFQSDVDGAFEYGVEAEGNYVEEYRLTSAGAVRTTIRIRLGTGSNLGSLEAGVTVLDFGADPTGVADSEGATSDAIASFGINGGKLRFPTARYRFSNQLEVTTGMNIIGDGRSRNPGQVGSTTYAYPDFITGTVLQFDAGVPGILAVSNSDAALAADGVADYEFPGFTWGKLQGFSMLSMGGGTTSTHGLQIRAISKIEDVYVRGFAGDGVRVQADAGSANPVPYGNASCALLTAVESSGNGGDGFRIDGRDANACVLVACKADGNTGWGFNDTSLLGNTYIGCESDVNGTGSFRCPGGVTGSVYVGCYSEGGLTDLGGDCLVLGGQLAQVGLHPADTEAYILCGGGLSIGAPLHHRNAAGTKVINFATGARGASNVAFRWWDDTDFNIYDMVLDYRPDWWSLLYGGSIEFIQYPKASAGARAFAPSLPQGLFLGVSGGGPRIFYDTAAPTAGTWHQGDVVFNASPSAGGVPGWSCVSSGTPGTWKAWASLAA